MFKIKSINEGFIIEDIDGKTYPINARFSNDEDLKYIMKTESYPNFIPVDISPPCSSYNGWVIQLYDTKSEKILDIGGLYTAISRAADDGFVVRNPLTLDIQFIDSHGNVIIDVADGNKAYAASSHLGIIQVLSCKHACLLATSSEWKLYQLDSERELRAIYVDTDNRLCTYSDTKIGYIFHDNEGIVRFEVIENLKSDFRIKNIEKIKFAKTSNTVTISTNDDNLDTYRDKYSMVDFKNLIAVDVSSGMYHHITPKGDKVYDRGFTSITPMGLYSMAWMGKEKFVIDSDGTRIEGYECVHGVHGQELGIFKRDGLRYVFHKGFIDYSEPFEAKKYKNCVVLRSDKRIFILDGICLYIEHRYISELETLLNRIKHLYVTHKDGRNIRTLGRYTLDDDGLVQFEFGR